MKIELEIAYERCAPCCPRCGRELAAPNGLRDPMLAAVRVTCRPCGMPVLVVFWRVQASPEGAAT